MSTRTPSASPTRQQPPPHHAAPPLPAISSLLSQLSRSHHTPSSHPALVTLGPTPLYTASSSSASSSSAQTGFVPASAVGQSAFSGSVRSSDAAHRTDDDTEAAANTSTDPSSQPDQPNPASAQQSSTLAMSSLASLRRLLDTETAADLAASNIIQSPSTTAAYSTTASSSSATSLQPATLPPGLSSQQYRDIGGEAVWSVSSCKSGNGVPQLRDNQLDTFWQSDGHAPHTVSLVFARKVSVAAVCLYVDFKVDESYTPCKVSVRGGSSVHSMHDVAVMELEEPTGWITVRTLIPQAKRHKAEDDVDEEAERDRQKKTAASSASTGLRPSSFFSASSPTGRLVASATSAASTPTTAASCSSSGLSYVPLRCHHLQVVIHSSHQQGKDTHVREMRVYGDGSGAGGAGRGARGRVDGKENSAMERRSIGQKVALLHPVFTSIEFQSTACLR